MSSGWLPAGQDEETTTDLHHSMHEALDASNSDHVPLSNRLADDCSHCLPAFSASHPLLGQSTLPSRTRTWTSSSSYKSYKTLLHQSAQSTDPPDKLILSCSEAQRLQMAFQAKALEAIAVGNLAPGIELELIAALDLETIMWSQFPVPWRGSGEHVLWWMKTFWMKTCVRFYFFGGCLVGRYASLKRLLNPGAKVANITTNQLDFCIFLLLESTQKPLWPGENQATLGAAFRRQGHRLIVIKSLRGRSSKGLC